MRWCLKEYHRFVPVPFTPSISKYASIDVWKWVKDLFQKSTETLSLNRNRDFLAMLKSTSRKPIVQRTLLLRRFFRLPLRCVWTGLRYFFGRIEAIFCRMFYVFVVRRLTVYSSIFLLTTNAQHFTNIFTVNTTGFFAHQCNCEISRTHAYAHTRTPTQTPARDWLPLALEKLKNGKKLGHSKILAESLEKVVEFFNSQDKIVIFQLFLFRVFSLIC